MNKLFVRSALLLVLHVASQGQAFAQPRPYGCHYFRQAPGPLQYTDASRTQIAETIARSDTFDILHYDIHLDLTTFQASAFKAFTTVSFTPLMEGQERIRFDLYQLTVDSVVDAVGPLAFTYDGQFLNVQLANAPAIGDTSEITVHYHGAPHRDPEWGGFYYEGGYMYNLGIGISTIPPNFGKVWYPCFDSFVERATYTYHARTSGAFRLHGQGEFLGELQQAGDTVIRSFALPQAIPTHLSAVAVSAYTDSNHVHTGLSTDIPVRYTAKSEDLEAMAAKFGDMGAAIDVCEHWYGQYPYDRVGYVLTTDGALEIPTNIAYPSFMTGQSIVENRALFTHELGHHWWGDHVTPYVHNDMWLKEGPAEYSGHLIEEWIGGREPFIRAVKDNHNMILRTAHVADGGFQALSPMPDPYIYGTHTYYKGASVMHNLRGYLGDALFQQALRGIQANLGNSTITAEGFKEALEQYADVDLDPFFNGWVFAPGYSVFEVRDFQATANGGIWTVDLEIGQKLYGATVMHEEVPLDVTFLGADGAVHEATIVAGGALDGASMEVPFQPVMVVLNRQMRLNQARMDHEITIVPGVNFNNVLPYVDFRLYGTNVVDSTLVRVDHIFCAPDQDPVVAGVTAMSGTHYWNVDGLWPEGTVLEGRVYYQGEDPGDFDHDLVNGDETGMVLLHRRTASDTWTLAPNQTISPGGLTNGTGMIKVNDLQKGQYAFAKAEALIGVEERADRPFIATLGPVPTGDALTVSGTFDGTATVLWDFIAADGRLAQQSTTQVAGAFQRTLDVSHLAVGSYVLRATQQAGGLLFERRIEVVR